ncbi:MAG: hypothetical protein MRY83_14520 [Flavobacteriales bacterium]|nr:hypothetical protein [Flavobacteriales bacterium]
MKKIKLIVFIGLLMNVGVYAGNDRPAQHQVKAHSNKAVQDSLTGVILKSANTTGPITLKRGMIQE